MMEWRTWLRTLVEDGNHTITLTGRDPVRISRVKFRVGDHIPSIDYPGHDICQGRVLSFDDCADRCNDTPDCAGFSYHDAEKYCWHS